MASSTSKTPTMLKSPPSTTIPPWPGASSTLTSTPVPPSSDSREFYLSNLSLTSPPLTSASPFLPTLLITHLMRQKKDSALGSKYFPGDHITNMEGALHTFITPIAKTYMFGDYVFRNRHGVQRFGSSHFQSKEGGTDQQGKLAREVILSASIQPDFEGEKVMLSVCKLGREEIIGKELDADWEILDTEKKKDRQARAVYDDGLRKLMIVNLISEGRLPARKDVFDEAMDRSTAIAWLERFILSSESRPEEMIGKFVKIGYVKKEIISLELLFNTAVHQLRNEISALEAVAKQGYVYTYDPASIFAREIGADILNRMMFAALRTLSGNNEFTNMRAFGFNDYADRKAMELADAALEKQRHVKVVPKRDLFRGPDDTYDPKGVEGGENAWLVIHNNSDGFGQNIETEGEFGSLDGAVGANSSAAASLQRQREDLLKYVI